MVNIGKYTISDKIADKNYPSGYYYWISFIPTNEGMGVDSHSFEKFISDYFWDKF